MRVLITGQNGQLAKSLATKSATNPDIQCIFAARPQLDLVDQNSIESVIGKYHPDVIINAAAYTQVDKAEEESVQAFAINAHAPGQIADAASEIGARLIHLSTDYVYDGTKSSAYVEADAPNPQSVYGKSKLAGEMAIRDVDVHHVILRTAWVYSPYGRNFVKSILNAAQKQDHLRVVDDQIGNPTSALDLADAIFEIIKSWQAGGNEGLGEIFHCAGSGQTSWCGLAQHVLETSRTLSGSYAEVEAIPASQWPTPARRPDNSVLDCSRFVETFGYRLPEWRVSVEETVRKIIRGQAAA